MILRGFCFLRTLILSFPDVCTANPDAKRLFDDLLSSYNKLVKTFLGHWLSLKNMSSVVQTLCVNNRVQGAASDQRD